VSGDQKLTPAKARYRLQALLEDVQDALAPHDNIRSDDSQYEDPEEWWLRPLLRNLKATIQQLDET
jgi:hypothetical protein